MRRSGWALPAVRGRAAAWQTLVRMSVVRAWPFLSLTATSGGMPHDVRIFRRVFDHLRFGGEECVEQGAGLLRRWLGARWRRGSRPPSCEASSRSFKKVLDARRRRLLLLLWRRRPRRRTRLLHRRWRTDRSLLLLRPRRLLLLLLRPLRRRWPCGNSKHPRGNYCGPAQWHGDSSVSLGALYRRLAARWFITTCRMRREGGKPLENWRRQARFGRLGRLTRFPLRH